MHHEWFRPTSKKSHLCLSDPPKNRTQHSLPPKQQQQKGVLMKYVQSADFVDQSQKLLNHARMSLGGVQRGSRSSLNPDGKYIHSRLQEYTPEEGAYDLICMQWVAMYMTDVDLLSTLKRYKFALKSQGMIFFKDSVLEDRSTIRHSVLQNEQHVRTEAMYNRTFKEAGLTVIATQTQQLPPGEDGRTPRPVVQWLLGAHEITTVEEGGGAVLMGKDSESGEFFYSLPALWEAELGRKKWYNGQREWLASRCPPITRSIGTPARPTSTTRPSRALTWRRPRCS
eukprot:NODE_601_length_1568_cov_106.087558_g495_i0.p1 GENE.NODE_601_length_1568_cov_106.087558_g495_i0~~NODE_601_length_1568_cov_106.087558_g495_i0.p1  ORF type:complete len:283 (-),score=64.12 NODE_601_length_1568_cov_106.087558_g495_i0:618-1466(-)